MSVLFLRNVPSAWGRDTLVEFYPKVSDDTVSSNPLQRAKVYLPCNVVWDSYGKGTATVFDAGKMFKIPVERQRVKQRKRIRQVDVVCSTLGNKGILGTIINF